MTLLFDYTNARSLLLRTFLVARAKQRSTAKSAVKGTDLKYALLVARSKEESIKNRALGELN